MNARSLVILMAGLAAPLAWAEPSFDYVPMKIQQTEPVNYPHDVAALGLTEGAAQIVVQVDEKGALTDALVIGYTHKSFADAALEALGKWKYEPAYIEGRTHGATMNLTFVFEMKGLVIVNVTVDNILEVQRLRARSDLYGAWACTLSQLDRIPTPRTVVRPRYPMEPSKAPQSATVTVHFYIDKEGKVRMPAVSRETTHDANLFAAEAIAAISQWEFEPPLSHGRPVLVAASQDFKFKPAP